MKKNILIIAPHADDEVLGCGGTINKFSKDYNVHVLVMTDAHKGVPKKYSINFSNKIKKQCLRAHKILGVKKTHFFDLPVLGLQKIDNYLIADKIKLLLTNIKPNQVYLCSKHDLHSDHRYIYEAALVALRDPKSLTVKKILCYETPSESEWGNELIRSERLNFFIELSKINLNKKISAIKVFKSEYKLKPHPRSEENLEALARIRGGYILSEFAEAFSVVKIIN